MAQRIYTKLQTIAENVQKVYDAGHEAGKKAEYDAFWDCFQNYGNRKHYGGCFGSGFNSKNLKPKYPIRPVKSYSGDSVAMYMFCHTNRDQTFEELTDISHIEFDFSKINSKVNDRGINYMFYNAYVDNIILDLTNVTSISNLFTYSDSGDIGPKNITLTVSESLTAYSNTFNYLKSPTRIIFTEGSVIARSINFQYCTKLVAESAISIINALKNYLGTDKELTYTLTLPSAVWDRLEASGIPPSESTWKDYVSNVKGWKVV